MSEDLGSEICSVEVSSLDPQDFKNRSIIWHGFSHRLSESGLTRAILKVKLCQHEDSEFLVYDYGQAKQFNVSLPIKAAEEGGICPDSVIETEGDSDIAIAPTKLAKFSILCEQKDESSSLSPFDKGYSMAG